MLVLSSCGMAMITLGGVQPRPGAFCRNCFALCEGAARCPACGGLRVLAHPELFSLHIAHVDCDAFYASVEKRDRPELASTPVIIGGGVRGVVSTCCYIARMYGVGSAMPMARARALCPDAVVIAPDFAKYHAVATHIRTLMQALTPLVLPLSIDEAVLDMAGTAALHGAPPAVMLARLAAQIETSLGVTVSVGLAANRMLARIAAGRDKPRGFSVLGAEAAAVLACEKLGILPGVGAVRAKKLALSGFTLVGQIQALSARDARRLLGDDGPGLVGAANGQDDRRVDPARARAVTISVETTFDVDLRDADTLAHHLWRLAEKLAVRLSTGGQAAAGVVLKLKTADFKSRTRAARLSCPTLVPDVLFEAASKLLAREADGTAFRLIGIGAAPLADIASADAADLADPDAPRRAARQAAIAALRQKFGEQTIQRGRALPRTKPGGPD